MMAEHKIIWSVCGGSFVRGKSVVAVNIATALASLGRAVLLADADPAACAKDGSTGGAASLLGMDGRCDYPPGADLRTSIASNIIPTDIDGLTLLSGAGRFFGAPGGPASSGAGEAGFTRALLTHYLDSEADCLVVDIGGSGSGASLDLAALSNEMIVVFGPSPDSVKASFEFLKSFVYRRVERLFSENPLIYSVIDEATDAARAHPARTFADLVSKVAEVNERAAHRAVAEVKGYRPALLLNMVSSEEDLAAVAVLSGAATSYLGLETTFAGALRADDVVRDSAAAGAPFAVGAAPLADPQGSASQIGAVVSVLLGGGAALPAEEPVTVDEPASASVFEEVFGFNDNETFEGTVFHIQTEVGGGPDPYIETIVYQGGRVYFSKRVRWSEAKDSSGQVCDIRGFAKTQHRSAMAAVRQNKIMYRGGA